MDQYMALSKKDLMIHITLNELYNTHSLILQHIETLVRSLSYLKQFGPKYMLSFCSRQMTNNIYAFSQMSLDLLQHKYRVKKTELLI